MQIGLGSSAVRLDNISPAEERLVDALYYGLPAASAHALAAQSKLQPPEIADFLLKLQPVLVSTQLQAVPGTESYSVAQAEVARASLDNAADAVRIVERRKQASVHIETLDATGITLLLALAAAGVGHFTSSDSARVSATDAASNAIPVALEGKLRGTAAKLILQASWPGSRLLSTLQYPSLLGKSTLAVITNQQVTPPQSVARWQTRELPVLEIRYVPNGVQISPVLLASTGNGCLQCRDHFEQDADSTHIAVSSQLVTSALRFDDAATRLVATGLAATSVLRFIDAGSLLNAGVKNQATRNQNVEYLYLRNLAGAKVDPQPCIQERTWQRHPLCGCSVSERLLSQAV